MVATEAAGFRVTSGQAGPRPPIPESRAALSTCQRELLRALEVGVAVGRALLGGLPVI